MSISQFDVCIRGAGIVGRALALSLGQAKLRVALVDGPDAGSSSPQPTAVPRDVRAYALNPASRELLQQLRCWPAADAATPVRAMQVHGDAGGTVRFDAATATAPSAPQADADALAWIVDVPALEDILTTALRFQAGVELVSAPVEAPLTAICEGKFSASREGLGVDYEVQPYPQHAIATRVRASRPHGGVASQWFSGPHIVALLPLGGAQGNDYAVVWSTDLAHADTLMALDDEAFTAQLQATITQTQVADHGTAGPDASPPFTPLGPRARWPLRLARARHWIGSMPVVQPAGQRQISPAWVLLGDAAHTVHPLAGSGLNLGLGDVAALRAVLAQREAWRNVADRRLLRNYERERKSALLPYAAATDGLQWLFWQEQPWLQTLRNWGMKGFAASGPVKHWIARQATRA